MDYVNKNFAILKDKTFVRSLVFSFLAFFVAIIVNYFAAAYANKMASSSVTDVFLSNIPAFDVNILFAYGPILFWIFIFIVLLKYKNRIPFAIYSIFLFIIIRSIFITLTHLGPIPTQSAITHIDFISRFSAGNDFFFSGHTGLPFLMALVFWDRKSIRIICLLSSIFFGAIVLLGHYHYSIDVLSAFFITYSIYKMAEVFFKKEKNFFNLIKS
ncbi:MAG: phosphatase PAP2-related protein [Candidatus Paceibacterota bacterium]|jgi:hypothetical protein